MHNFAHKGSFEIGLVFVDTNYFQYISCERFPKPFFSKSHGYSVETAGWFIMRNELLKSGVMTALFLVSCFLLQIVSLILVNLSSNIYFKILHTCDLVRGVEHFDQNLDCLATDLYWMHFFMPARLLSLRFYCPLSNLLSRNIPMNGKKSQGNPSVKQIKLFQLNKLSSRCAWQRTERTRSARIGKAWSMHNATG